jgi:VIT1/CCC1 family predicted Fe2+/Mn2+ transporter
VNSIAVTDIARRYLRDLIYGANDGIITTFAVVAGVTGADLSTTVILILGVSNLLADGFSMAASDYLSLRSEAAALESEGKQTAQDDSPFKHGLATFVAFVTAGVVPLAAYLVPLESSQRFPAAIALTFLTLFVVGASRSIVTRRSWMRSGLEMLAVGALAAVVAYVIGASVASVTG